MNPVPKPKKAKKPIRKRLIVALDQEFSKIVRERDKICRCCGKNNQIYCHHIFSRKHLATRWTMQNGIGICWACHKHKAHGDPEAFRDWVLSWMGEATFNRLKEMAYSPCKISTESLGAILRAMKCGVDQ